MRLTEIEKNNNIENIINALNDKKLKSEKEIFLLYQDFFKNIKKECSEIIKIYKNTSQKDRFLFRGMKKDKNIRVLQLSIREDRLPRDSPKELHDFFNQTIKELGFVTNRSNSIFCTPSISDAKLYGTVFIIFPKNGFSYLWGKKIKDLYSLMVKINQKETKKIHKKNKLSLFIGNVLYYAESEEKLKNFYNDVVKLLMQILDRVFGEKYKERKKEYMKEKNFNYVQNPTRDDIETLLKNFEYQLLIINEDELKKLAEKNLKKDLKFEYEKIAYEAIKENYTDKNLEDAILNHKNEIMISNPTNKEYFAINIKDKEIVKNIIKNL